MSVGSPRLSPLKEAFKPEGVSALARGSGSVTGSGLTGEPDADKLCTAAGGFDSAAGSAGVVGPCSRLAAAGTEESSTFSGASESLMWAGDAGSVTSSADGLGCGDSSCCAAAG